MDNRPTAEEIMSIEENFYHEGKIQQIKQLEINPLLPEHTRANRIIDKPPPMQFIANFKGSGFIKKGIVGAFIAAGGTGKSFWLMSLASILASGGKWGDIEAVDSFNVLMLCAEDDEETLAHRIWAINEDSSPYGLYIASTMGICGPIIDKNGRQTMYIDWIKNTIDAHNGIDVLILDPKSRFFSGDENSNDDNTRFVQAIESISKEKNCTVIFSHHVSKNGFEKGLTSAMSRGGSALIDGARFCIAAAELDEKECSKFGVEEGKFIKIKLVKTNYTGKTGDIYYRRGESGELTPVDLVADQMANMANYFIHLLNHESGKYTRREIERGIGGAKEISKELKRSFDIFNGRNMMVELIDFCLKNGFIYEQNTSSYKKNVFTKGM